MSDDQLARVRNREIGFVFQTFNLLPRATALHNVELPLVYAGVPSAERKRRAAEALEKVQLGDRIMHKPNELSGGQRQRVAIARALVMRPRVIVADEAVSALDVTIQSQILALIKRLQGIHGFSLIFISHDLGVIAQVCDRVVVMYRGRVVEQGTKDSIFDSPQHEYTLALLRALPELVSQSDAEGHTHLAARIRAPRPAS
jgi:ABC-type glutathione transport system ATPase component